MLLMFVAIRLFRVSLSSMFSGLLENTDAVTWCASKVKVGSEFLQILSNTIKQCIHMCVRTRAYALALARVLYRFSSFLVKGIH